MADTKQILPNVCAVRKTTIESVQNNTFQSDNELFLPVEANSYYLLEMLLRINSGATPDFKMQFSVPSGTTVYYNTLAAAGAINEITGATPNIPTTGADQQLQVIGTVATGATAGDLTLQWAQNTTTASNTSVLPHSWLRLMRVP